MRSVIREAWRLAAPCWRSDERWRAWLLLGAVIALNLANVYIDVRINQWNNAFFNAIQEKDSHEFFKQLGVFSILAFAAVVISVYALYLNQMLNPLAPLDDRALRRKWLAHRIYFRPAIGRQRYRQIPAHSGRHAALHQNAM